MRIHTTPILLGSLALVIIISLATLGYNLHRQTTSPTPTPTPTATSTPTATPTTTATPSPSPTASPTATPGQSYTQLMGLGVQAYQKKDYQSAEAFYKQSEAAASSGADSAGAFLGLADTYRDSGSSTLAIANYNLAIKADSTSGQSYLNEAALYWQLKDKTNAIATLQAGVSAAASEQSAIVSLLDVYQHLTP